MRPKGRGRRPGVDALAIVTVVSVVCFGIYTAVKAAYLSTVFANLTLERNLIFLVPLLFAGTALFFERRGGRWWAVVAAGCFALYLVHTTPYSLTQYPNYEAHGLAIIALANRIFRWPADTIEHALVTVTIVVDRGARTRPSRCAPGGSPSLVTSRSRRLDARLDRHGGGLRRTRREPLLRAALRDPAEAGELARPLDPGRVGDVPRPGRSRIQIRCNLLEFWNRSLTKVWALDGTAPGSRRDRDARPQEPGWDARRTPTRASSLVTAGRGHRRTTARRAGRGIHAVQARRTAAAPNGPDRGLSRRLDGAVCELYPVRRPARDTRARTRRPQAILVRQGQFAARC